jgi:uncharacterized protein with NRDE domain
VGITNRWISGGGDRSRGLLVADALRARSARGAVDQVTAELDTRRYAPFHLVVADTETCTVVRNGGTDDTIDGARVTSLEPGVHVVVNVGVDGEWFVPSAPPDAARRQAHNADRVREDLEARPREHASAWLDRAGTVLGDHEYGVCHQVDRYGTRSSSLLALGSDRTFRFAPGPPCETSYERVEDRI